MIIINTGYTAVCLSVSLYALIRRLRGV